jgi:predicted XRE-type DNA-binding protein
MRATNSTKCSVENSRMTTSPWAHIGKGIGEIRVTDDSGAYRVIYCARRAEAVYVLHAFQKKTQTTLRRDIRDSPATLCPDFKRWEMTRTENYTSVWGAIADTPGQAANLRARAELMQQIAAFVKRRAWTQAEAASHCGVTQPRINDLLRGRVSRFSLDALVNISAALGGRVRVDLEAA